MVAAMKHMASNFAKFKKFEEVDFRRWQKKMQFLLSSMSVVGLILNGMSDSLFDVYQNVETSKELWDTLEAKYMVEDASSKKFFVSNFTNYKLTDSRPILEQYNELLGILGRFTQHKMNMDESIQSWAVICALRSPSDCRIVTSKSKNVDGPSVVNMVKHNNSSRYNDNKGKRKHHDNKADPNKKTKMTCWKCGKPGHLKRNCKGGNVGNKANGPGTKGSGGGSSNPLKDRCWFKTYESLNDGSILHIGNESTALVPGRGCVNLRFSSGKFVSLLNVLHVPNIRKNLVSSSILNDCGYKQVIKSNKFVLSKHAFMSTSKLNDSVLWHARLGHVHFKRMQDMSKDGLIPAFDMDTKKYQIKVFKIEVELQQGSMIKRFRTDRGACYLLNRVPNKRNKITSYELWTKRKLNLNYLRVWDCRTVVRLPDPKLKTLGKRGIECIFVGYDEHSKALRFYVIEPNDSVSINSIIKSKDVIFDEHRFSSVPRPSQRSLKDGTGNFGGSMVSERVTKEKETVNDEMDSIMGNNTWVLTDLPPGCRPLGCKWIFKRKLKVDGTIKKFKARLVIQRFKQKSEIDYFDTYAPVARISTIRLLIAIASIHNLIIHQMDVKTAFLNGELEEDVYMNQPLGFIMPGNENKVDLTKEFLSSRFFMKDMRESYVIIGIRIKHESNGIVSHYIEKVLKKLNYSDCTPVSTPLPDIAFVVGKLSRYTSNPGTQHWQAIQRALKYLKKTMDYRMVYSGYPSVLEGYTDASWISNSKDNSSTSGWVFLLGGGAIFWAFKKQTCITGSTTESEFVAMAAADKEAEWLKILLLEIPLWYKPMASISIHCDSAATLAKAYSQMYNGKSRQLGVRHSMMRELITNGVISIEFVRSKQNLADHLTKGLSRDLIIKSVEGIGLKAEAHVLQIIPRMCLKPADKEDEVVNFSMVNLFEKVLSGSMNKEEPPM
nr:zinc finger, CCHC-type [Tanacetum cinerariifolium]